MDRYQLVKIMTTLECILIVVVVLLVIVLIPLICIAFVVGDAFDAIMPKFPSKSLWQTIVGRLHQFVGHS